jgi:hypothetical protein
MTLLTMCGTVFRAMASKTLQVQSAFEARFINMIDGAVGCFFTGCDGEISFLFVASRAGNVF